MFSGELKQVRQTFGYFSTFEEPWNMNDVKSTSVVHSSLCCHTFNFFKDSNSLCVLKMFLQHVNHFGLKR